MPPGHQLGKEGEDLAASLMINKGFRVIERQFRRRGGEIDLVCVFGPAAVSPPEEIVFVEVKTRAGRKFGRPESAVSGKKKIRMKRTAEIFLLERGLEDIQARFDVISIIRTGFDEHMVEHFEHAFGIQELMDDDPWNEWRF